MNEQRFIDLETKISFQEAVIDELQKVVNEQYVNIETLKKSLKQLTEKINTGEQAARPINEKPPHY
jgi:SlyX protein